MKHARIKSAEIIAAHIRLMNVGGAGVIIPISKKEYKILCPLKTSEFFRMFFYVLKDNVFSLQRYKKMNIKKHKDIRK